MNGAMYCTLIVRLNSSVQGDTGGARIRCSRVPNFQNPLEAGGDSPWPLFDRPTDRVASPRLDSTGLDSTGCRLTPWLRTRGYPLVMPGGGSGGQGISGKGAALDPHLGRLRGRSHSRSSEPIEGSARAMGRWGPIEALARHRTPAPKGPRHPPSSC
jgi:hypothetical protein